MVVGELSGSEIVEYAKQQGTPVHVYQYDKLPKHLKQGNYVILLGDRHGHWTALRVYKHTSAYYDSFGVNPPQEIINAIGKRILFYSDVEDQKLSQNHCGDFCLSFLYKINYEKSLRKAKGRRETT